VGCRVPKVKAPFSAGNLRLVVLPVAASLLKSDDSGEKRGCMGVLWNTVQSTSCRAGNRKLQTFWFLLAAFSLASCSGRVQGHVVSGAQGNNATLALTLRAIPLIPPPDTNLLSFRATIIAVSLTPEAGGSINVPLNSSLYEIDVTKLQSDTAFLALSTAIPPGSYTNMVISLLNPSVTYCTQTQGRAGCTPGSVTTLTGQPATPIISTIPFPLMLVRGQTTGLAIVLNLANALTVDNHTQVITGVNLGAPNVATAVMLPPASSSLPSGTLDFLDDVTGIVSSVDVAAQTLTVQTAKRGSVTAKVGPSTIVSPNCTTFHLGDTFACAKLGQVASLDITLNADGTFSLVEYDPLATVEGDWVEATVVPPHFSSTQFELVVSDLVLASSNSLIGSNLGLGAPVKVNLVNPKPFVVDSKGLIVPNTTFDGATDSSILQPGETLAVHVAAFTPESAASVAIVSVDFVYLRFTRVTGIVAVTAPPNTFTMQSFPPFFGLSLPVTVQLSNGSPSTNFDGINGAGATVSEQVVSVGALYFGPPTGPTPSPTPFSAAKVRVH